METAILIIVACIAILAVGTAIKIDTMSYSIDKLFNEEEEEINIELHIREYVKAIMHLKIRPEVHDVTFDMIYNPHNWTGDTTLTDDCCTVWAANDIMHRKLWIGEDEDDNELSLNGDEKLLLDLGCRVVKARLEALKKKTEIPY